MNTILLMIVGRSRGPESHHMRVGSILLGLLVGSGVPVVENEISRACF